MEDVLRPLSDIPAINRFLSYCRVRTIPAKTVMIHAGDLPDVLYYIVDGSVEVMIEDEDGNEMVLAYLNKGQFFGEMGLFYEQPQRSAWVRTRTESEIAEMEDRKQALQADLASPDVYRDGERVKEIMQAFDAATARLEQLYEHWEEAVELN